MPVTLKCPNCGAALTPPEGQVRHTCEYCGNLIDLQAQARPAPQRRPAPAPAIAPAPTITADHADVVASARSTVRILLMIFAAVAVVGLASAIMIAKTVSEMSGASEISGIAGSDAAAGIPGLASGEYALWDSVGGRPTPLVIAGKPALLGRIRVMPGDALYFVVAAADDAAILHRLGPFATYTEGYRHTRAASAGGRIAISDAQAKLHLFDAASGEELRVLDLSDRVELLCAGSDGASLWIQQVDKRALLVDPASGELREGERPAGCVDADEEAWGLIPSAPQRAALRRLDDQIEGFEAARILGEGGARIAAGYKAPGTAIPQAVGLGPDDEVRWRVDVPTVDPLRARERSNEHDALVAGRYITIYGEGPKTWHVTAVDASSGARLWDTPLRVIFAVDRIDGLVATGAHVFVTRTSSLEILDAATGALKATLGRESYED